MEPVQGLSSLSSEHCAACHVTIAEEWRQTGHAGASTAPLYRADLAQQATTYFCDHCHAPLVEQRPELSEGLKRVWPSLIADMAPNPRHQAGLHKEGVGCVSCHQRDGAMLGTFETALAPHPVKVSASLSSEETCRPCHSMDLRMLGDLERPLMDTFAEWEAYKAAGGDKNCVDCHMPERPLRPAARGGPPRPGRSHALLGPYNLEFVRQGAALSNLDLSGSHAQGVEAALTLTNATGHRLPTAEPHRKLVAALEVLDASGHVLQREEAVMQRVVDLHTLTEVPGSDTSLLPAEVRRIQLSLPSPLPAEAIEARMALRFVLWEPNDPVAQAAQLSAADLIMVLHEQRISLSTQASR